MGSCSTTGTITLAADLYERDPRIPGLRGRDFPDFPQGGHYHPPLPLRRGWDHAGQADEFFGVLGFVVDPDLVVHVGAGAAAGAAEKADLLMLGDPLPDRNDVAVKMGVKGGDAVSVIDLDHLAVVAVIAGVGHGPCRGGMNRGHVRRRQVDRGVKARAAIERIAARAEPALEL